ncbi:hypothetical protein E4K10_31225 [Streptomyces sp. T1317-0309]|nr:hypothetical protein E4K10_31225 [Streptomyces sp. T1317-0309]
MRLGLWGPGVRLWEAVAALRRHGDARLREAVAGLRVRGVGGRGSGDAGLREAVAGRLGNGRAGLGLLPGGGCGLRWLRLGRLLLRRDGRLCRCLALCGGGGCHLGRGGPLGRGAGRGRLVGGRQGRERVLRYRWRSPALRRLHVPGGVRLCALRGPVLGGGGRCGRGSSGALWPSASAERCAPVVTVVSGVRDAVSGAGSVGGASGEAESPDGSAVFSPVSSRSDPESPPSPAAEAC